MLGMMESETPYTPMPEHLPLPLERRDTGPGSPTSLLGHKHGMAGGEGTIMLACFSVFLTGGVVYGMSAMYPVLYAEGVLANVCTTSQQAECAAERLHVKCCDAQMLQYTLLTSAALLPSDAFVALYGELVDRVGPRSVYCTGQLMFGVGAVLLAVNSCWLDEAWLWYASFFALGAAGPGVFFSILFLSEKHPNLGPTITTLSAAMNDGSAVCFFVVQLVRRA